MFSLGKKSPDSTPSAGTPDLNQSRLLLHLGSMGYAAKLVDGQGQIIGQPHLWDGALVQEKESEPIQWQHRMEKIFRQAVGDLSKGPLRSAGSIAILLDSDRVVFSSNQPESLRAASDASARLYGQRLLNAQSSHAVTFGRAVLPPCGQQLAVNESGGMGFETPLTPEMLDRLKGGVFAFADVPYIRSLLVVLEQHGLKLQGLIPAPYLLIKRALLRPTQTYGAIHIGAHYTTIVLANCQINGLMVRYSPVGILTLGHAVATKTGTAIKSTLHNLGSRNLLPKPTELSVIKETATLAKNPYHEGLEPGLNQLVMDLRDSIDFFAGQRSGGMPESFECYGELHKINGLLEWLAQSARVDLQPAPLSLLDQMTTVDCAEECNLLRGAETSLLAVGRIKFTFTKAGFVKSETLAESRGKIHSSPTSRTRAGATANRRANRAAERRHGQSGTRSGMISAWWNKAKSFAGQPTNDFDDEQNPEDPSQKALRQGAIALASLFGLILYGAYDLYTEAAKKYLSTRLAYLNAQSANKTRMEDAKRMRLFSAGSSATDDHRVHWTEKFLSISQTISEHIWLTDIALTPVNQDAASDKKITKKLSIDGSVLPSTDGHILRIAEFLERLEDGTRVEFSKDFRDIRFNGSAYDHTDKVVRFNLDALYDRTKRLEGMTSAPSRNEGSGTK